MLNKTLGLGMASAMLIMSIQAGANDLAQHKNVGGMDVYYGVVPVEVVQSHIKEEHGTQPMHKKGWFARGTHHLVVSLYDAKTSQRITDAEATATVTPLGLAWRKKPLDRITINDAVSYGNYFSMPKGDTPYKIAVSIQRPGIHIPVAAEFDYRHPAKRSH